jgi:hypothetical protein
MNLLLVPFPLGKIGSRIAPAVGYDIGDVLQDLRL